MSTYEHLVVERHGPVGWLINDRPDVRNAMNGAMRDEFADAWTELAHDPAVRVIVHTGNGRDFQTGVDMSELASDGIGMERYRQSMEDFDVHFTSWHQDVWKPVVTAVNGICCGGGFHWIADADIVIAASDAQFFDPHTSVGQVVAIEAIGLIKKMPVEAVMRMAFMGKYERMGAERAYMLGMISEIVDPPTGSGSGPRRSVRRSRRTPRLRWRPPSAPSGCPRGRADRCLQGRRRTPRVNVGPPRPDRGPDGLR